MRWSQDTLSKQISLKLIALLQGGAEGNFDSLENCGDLMYSLNERQIVTGKVSNFDARVQSLTAERDSLQRAARRSHPSRLRRPGCLSAR